MNKKHISHKGIISKKPHLVILGGGFGGVHTYKALSSQIKRNYDITIVDRRNHFLFTPLLPEVAGASLDVHSIVEPIRDIIDIRHNFIQSTIISVDTQSQIVSLPDGHLDYDLLVSALGSSTYFYGTPGAEEYAYVLKELDDAAAIRNRFIDCFEAASKISYGDERSNLLTFIVVGAGPTGVELTGEAADLLFKTFTKQYGTIDRSEIKLVLVNSGAEVLGMFDESLRIYAEKSLHEDHVQIFNGVRIAEVTPEGVITSDGKKMHAGTVIWTAGVSANALTCTSDSFQVERGRIKVDKYMRALNSENVFIIGDMSLCETNDGRGLPMTAQVAKQQGITTAHNIKRIVNNKPLKEFKYHEKGLLASIGNYNAIAEIKGLKFKGLFAWFMWRAIYLFNFASGKKRMRILFEWTVNIFNRRDTTRL
ncbi:MAG: NADH dehydrogenase [Crocinitomicaceae bacterium]|jgi:NADH dehydrogenase